MNHLLVLPIVLPAMTAGLLLLIGNRLSLARSVSLISTLVTFLIATALVSQASDGSIQSYALSDWSAPFGIVMVLDRLSAMMVLLTAVVAVPVVLYAMRDWDQRGRFFHALLQFQLMGINGAFLTGDLFNLFVFFEVLLIASYSLLVYGLGERRLRATIHYVVINLTGSALFLIAVGTLYGVLGTLNMAHLAERLTQVSPSDVAIVQSAGLVLLGVFGIKAALFPIYFWLPAAYSSASAPVAALFAIMTKVGVYSIIRSVTLIFGAPAAATLGFTDPWLFWVAVITLALAALGALAAKRLLNLVAYLTVASVGTMLIAFSAGGVAGLSGALYYMPHSTIIVALMFLLAERISILRGVDEDMLVSGPHLASGALLGALFLVAAAVVAGLPLSAGFLGKLMILESLSDSPMRAAGWTVILLASLLTLVGLSRAGSTLFWKLSKPAMIDPPRSLATQWMALIWLFVGSLVLVLFAAPIQRYTLAMAEQLYSPAKYIESIVGSNDSRSPRALPSTGGQ